MAANRSRAGNGSSSGPTAITPSIANVYSKGVSRYGLSQHSGSGDVVTWELIDPQAIWGAIAAVTAAGDALMFSRTTDGGAYSITVMSGGKADKIWPKTTEEVHAVLTLLMERAG